MWPFDRTTRPAPDMGDCPHCGGRIVYGGSGCRNSLSIPVCTQCNESLDHSYAPSWVYVHVQTERRQQPSSSAKELLRASQLSPPSFVRSRYWRVYSIGNNVDVCYDSDCGEYDIVVDSETLVSNQNARQLLQWVASSKLLGNTEKA